jgi:endonuclease YncB( thermonuclease family)
MATARLRWLPLLIALLAGALALAWVASESPPPVAQAADRDCSDFDNQRQAQRFFKRHGGPQHDPHRLDGDGDGRACEALPCPCSSGGGGGGGGGHAGRDRTQRARVVSVTDGDTIKVAFKGHKHDVRLIGIDTPEVYGGVECGGRGASKSMKRKLDRGDRIKLIKDFSQDRRDRYGRLLRYVERRDRDIGKLQIAQGWAKVYVYNSNPFKRVHKYRRAKRRARAHDRGVWGRCGGDFHQPL